MLTMIDVICEGCKGKKQLLQEIRMMEIIYVRYD